MIIFQLIILLFSVIIHEVSHGTMAKQLGDDTAERMGRLTLNPLAHLDFFGSFLMPLLLYFTTSGRFVFGWAKPVPYNPLNLKHPRRDTALVAFAGPMANLLLALTLGLIIRLHFFGESIVYYLAYIVLINISLAIFNLVPLPPLDGSKIFLYFFPSQKLEFFLLQYGNLLLIFFLIFGWQLIQPLILILFLLFTGLIL